MEAPGSHLMFVLLAVKIPWGGQVRANPVHLTPMITNKTKSTKERPATQANSSTTEPKGKTIKLGIDVHLDRFVVVRIVDGGTPQPPQRFTPTEFLLWAGKPLRLAEQVVACYQAGPFGYTLHRKLLKMGITNYVVGKSRQKSRGHI